MIRSTLVLLAAGIGLVATAEAQEADEGPLVGLETGQSVRIRVEGEERIVSRVERLDPSSARLWLEGQSNPVAAMQVDSLWLGGRAVGTGALVGGLVGGVLSFGLLALACNGVSEGNGCDEWGTVAALSLAGAAGGAVVGAGIGALSRSWTLRYAKGGGLELSLAIPTGRRTSRRAP